MTERDPPTRSELVAEDMHDSSTRIVIKIETSELIQLGDFGCMLQSVASDYRRFLDAGHPEHTDVGVLIGGIHRGSVLIDLVQTLAPIVLADEHARLATGFIQFYKEFLSPYLTIGGRAKNVSQSDLESFRNTAKFIASLREGGQSFEAVRCYEKDGEKVLEKFRLGESEAFEMWPRIEQHINEIKSSSPERTEHKKQLMRFQRVDRGDADPNRLSGERVIIEQITQKDRPLIYGTKSAKEKIKNEIRESYRNVLRKMFVVDVVVEQQEGRIGAYRVMKVHQVIDWFDE